LSLDRALRSLVCSSIPDQSCSTLHLVGSSLLATSSTKMNHLTPRFVWAPRQDHDDAHRFLGLIGATVPLPIMRQLDPLSLSAANAQRRLRQEFNRQRGFQVRRENVLAGLGSIDMPSGVTLGPHERVSFEWVAPMHLTHLQLTNYLFGHVLPDPYDVLPRPTRRMRNLSGFETKLPLELRQKIWRELFPSRGRVKIDLKFHRDHKYSIIPSYIPVTLWVNRESRAETLRNYAVLHTEIQWPADWREGTRENMYWALDPNFDRFPAPLILNIKKDLVSFNYTKFELNPGEFEDWLFHINLHSPPGRGINNVQDLEIYGVLGFHQLMNIWGELAPVPMTDAKFCAGLGSLRDVLLRFESLKILRLRGDDNCWTDHGRVVELFQQEIMEKNEGIFGGRRPKLILNDWVEPDNVDMAAGQDDPLPYTKHGIWSLSEYVDFEDEPRERNWRNIEASYSSGVPSFELFFLENGEDDRNDSESDSLLSYMSSTTAKATVMTIATVTAIAALYHIWFS
jgi:hypothetical protein